MNKTLPSFERLLKMAQEDPEALERLRQKHIDHAISSAPEEYQQRLAGLQFQIDGQRRLAKNPTASCLNISKMMHDSLHQLKGFIEGKGEQKAEQEKATVVAFPSGLFN